MTKRAFGELEGQILYILQSGERKTVKEVHQSLGGQDNYNTVMTVMSRLAEKKKLLREKIGLQYAYWSEPATTTSTVLSKLKSKLFGVKTSVLVGHLIETAEDLTDEDIAKMEEILKQAKELKK